MNVNAPLSRGSKPSVWKICLALLNSTISVPIIVFDPSWADVLTAWLKGDIKIQRHIDHCRFARIEGAIKGGADLLWPGDILPMTAYGLIHPVISKVGKCSLCRHFNNTFIDQDLHHPVCCVSNNPNAFLGVCMCPCCLEFVELIRVFKKE